MASKFKNLLGKSQYLAPVLSGLLLLITLNGCGPHSSALAVAESPPFFHDDGNSKDLLTASQHQLSYLDRLDKGKDIVVGNRSYSPEELKNSLAAFIEIITLNLTPAEQDQLIREKFTVYQAAGRNGSAAKQLLVTGYYEPLLQGSLNKDPPFIYPLYAPPNDLIIQSSASGGMEIGRLEPAQGSTLQPYWTREEIDSSSLLHGHELVYLKDRFDAFLLHVQGSGRIQLPNGEIRAIRYRANNGHPYSSIGKLLVDKKVLTLAEADVQAIRDYLGKLPDGEVSKILYHNRRYIFFGWGSGKNPRGSTGLPLTPERSVAIDGAVLPMPTIAYLVTRRPVFNNDGSISHWVPLRRFVLPQDTGSAIKGAGRVDFFWGSGSYAEKAAGKMKEPGKLYFLIKKD